MLRDRSGIHNMDRCRAFYETYGAPMIHERFGDYEERIAVGFAGEGSDCFGYDDYVSVDHDFGLGFVMWLTKEDYQAIGGRLAEAYREIVRMASGEEDSVMLYADGRRGPMTIDDFFRNILGVDVSAYGMGAGKTAEDISTRFWFTVSDDKLATATNGEIYRDDLGIFSNIRQQLLSYYPEKIRLLKLAEQLYHFSQNAQSNYARCMVRGDYVTANVCVAQGMKSAMSICYLLGKKYAPYYKWMRRGMDELDVPGGVCGLLDEIAVMPCQKEAWEGRVHNPYMINEDDLIVSGFEKIAVLIAAELQRQGITDDGNPFLDVHSKKLFAGIYGGQR